MKSLLRLAPFVWQQRGRLFVSFTVAAGVALIWTAALLLVFPVVKVLLEGQSLGDYVSAQLNTAHESVQRETQRRAILDADLAQLRLENDEELIARREADRLACVASLNHAANREWQFRWLQTRVVPYLDEDRFTMLAQLMTLLLVFAAVKSVATYFQEILISASVERIMQTIRDQMFRSTLRLDLQTIAHETTPQLMSRFTFDLQQMAVGLTLLGSKAVTEPLKAVTCIACAFAVNWRLTALSFVCAPVAVLLFGHLGQRLKRASRRQMESMSRVYRALIEPLQSFTSVLAFRNERLHRRKLARENQDYYEKAMRIVRIDALSSPAVEFLAMVGVFFASLPGAYLVLQGQTSIWGVRLAAYQMEPSELALLYTLLAGVLDPARRIASIFSKVKKSAAASERVFGWMDRRSLVQHRPEMVGLPRHSQTLEFENVTFRYLAGGAERPAALDRVTLKIPFGATVAVVGGNGSGKSTLVSLLPRLFDPQHGSVRIDGIDISHVDPRELRQQIGIVTQDTLLFDMTIEDNIRYGWPHASESEIHDAARRAHVLSFVSQMPDGLQTGVGDRGHRLSGGQRQRVALARAILRNPSLLILDEATSAVDLQSEQLIHESLADLTSGRTTLIVTHTVSQALLDQITHVLVMEQGRVVAFGPHQDVSATCPAYQRLFDGQARKKAA